MNDNMQNKRKTPIGKFLLIALAIFIVSVLVSIVTSMLLTDGLPFAGLNEISAGLVIGAIEGAVGAISAGFVLYQLRISDSLEERQNDIEESKFLLQYNQAFIQDPNMCKVERRLEQWLEGSLQGEALVNDENRQLFVNYLVYLEGMAPLVFRDVLRLDHIDDLMAYRYFLAVNNPELQRDQLFSYPDYYRGCLKLYTLWKNYRHSHQFPILLNKYSLDKWVDFEEYTSSEVTIRLLQSQDDLKTAAGLLYDTDPFIYPAAFGARETAQKILPRWMEQRTFFYKGNCFAAVLHDKIVGVTLIESSKAEEALPLEYRGMPISYRDVRERYFNAVSDALGETPESIYIACVCVDKRYRGERIGEMLIKQVIKNYPDCRITLDVLSDNQTAIRLYQKYGFRIVQSETGYAYDTPGPACKQMVYSSCTLSENERTWLYSKTELLSEELLSNCQDDYRDQSNRNE